MSTFRGKILSQSSRLIGWKRNFLGAIQRFQARWSHRSGEWGGGSGAEVPLGLAGTTIRITSFQGADILLRHY